MYDQRDAQKIVQGHRIDETEPTMLFVGVSTSKSFVQRVFPEWTRIIGHKARLQGIDLEINSGKTAYQQLADTVKANKKILGALVTSHKANLFEHAAEVFEEIGPNALALREICAIYKIAGKLACEATDPLAVQQVLNRLTPQGYWHKTAANALILGAGGAGVALAYSLLSKGEDSPSRILITEVNPARVDSARAILSPFDSNRRLQVIQVDGSFADGLLACQPEGSLIVNATGMGKDRPGSPISAEVQFPRNSIAWEFNYRGDLQFIQIARSQVKQRGVIIEDGWFYFVCGWAYVMSKVFNFVPNELILSRFTAAVEAIRNEP